MFVESVVVGVCLHHVGENRFHHSASDGNSSRRLKDGSVHSHGDPWKVTGDERHQSKQKLLKEVSSRSIMDANIFLSADTMGEREAGKGDIAQVQHMG